jgi:hypothetical protein
MKQQMKLFLIKGIFYSFVFFTFVASALASKSSIEYYEEWLEKVPLLYHGTREDFIEKSLELARVMEELYGLGSVYDLSIPVNQEVQRISGEYYKAGNFFNFEMDFPELEEGKTIYIVYLYQGNFRLIYSPEIPDKTLSPDADEILVTHRSLFSKLQESFYDAIVCAGEINIVNGRINEVNNRSNTFRGQKKHLDTGLMFFRTAGFEIEGRTKLVDFSDEANHVGLPHTTSLERAKIFLEVKGLKSYNRYVEAYRLLYENYPDPNSLGYVDVMGLMNVTPSEKMGAVGTINDINQETAHVSFKKIALGGRGIEFSEFLSFSKELCYPDRPSNSSSHKVAGFDDPETMLKDLYRSRELLRGQLSNNPDDQSLLERAEQIDKDINKAISLTSISKTELEISSILAKLSLTTQSSQEEIQTRIKDVLFEYFGEISSNLSVEELNMMRDIYKYISYVYDSDLPNDLRVVYDQYQGMIASWFNVNSMSNTDVNNIYRGVIQNPKWKDAFVKYALQNGRSGRLRVK